MSSDGRMIDGEFQPWGGACQCRRCRQMVGREGFWRASRAEYAEAEALRREIAERDAYEMEQLPHVRTFPSRETFAEYAARVKEWRKQRGGG